MALSSLAVRRARTTDKACALSDIGGLSLAASSGGGNPGIWPLLEWSSKTNVSRCLSGSGGRDTRLWRDEAHASVAGGINPRIYRKPKCQAICLAVEYALKAICLRWVECRKVLAAESNTANSMCVR